VCRSPQLRQFLMDLLPLAGQRLLPLLRAKLTAAAPESVVALFGLLPQVGGQVEDLVEVARHPSERVRLAVVEALANLPKSPRATEIAVRYLADQSPKVRVEARGLVRRSPLNAAAVAGVTRLLADQTQPREVHALLIEALGDSELEQAAHLLYQLVQPHGMIESAAAVAVRELAAVALVRCPARNAGSYCRQGLESPTRRVRRAFQRAKDGDR
jgi:HEAT repeat protein